MYTLTEEGRKYLDEGLPEKKLAELVKNGKISIDEAKKKIDNFSIALQWARKNNWIMAVQGEIEIIKYTENSEIEDALKAVSDGKNVDDKILALLLQRKLVERIKESLEKKAEKFIGKEVTNLNTELIKTGLWRKVRLKHYNVEAAGKIIYPGKRQPYNRFLYQVRKKLVELGFKEMSGPTIETEFWNFDAMFQAQNHPSRDWTQTYSLKYPEYGNLPDKKIVENVKAAHENGWKTGSTGWGYKWDPRKASLLMPRAHGTALSARTIASKPKIPGKYFAIVRCYRPDVIDATHGVEFNQTEGIVIDESMNFKNLLGLLKQFAVEFAGAEKVKFLADYYPFTEPSVQLSAKHPDLGWIEFAGAGIFRPEFTEPLGVKEPVLAWGMGIDRLAMFKLDIKDIRYLFSQDIDWLRRQVI